MKGKLLNIGAVLLILFGVGLLSYPTIGNWLAERHQSTAIQMYEREIAETDTEYIEAELAKATKYNDALTGRNIEDPFLPESGMVLPANYMYILNLTDNGSIGYVEIPEIDVNLPIYHGVSEEVLQKGVGHMENTAFPTGGEGNHSVLTGHTGLTHAKLFTDLEKLELEDIFYIHVLGQTLAYQVDQILVVDPDQTEALFPVKGEDYVTLVTCTPYAINSHRLLVRGTSIPYVEPVETDIADTMSKGINWHLVMVIGFVVIMTTFFIVYKYVEKQRSKNEKESQEIKRANTG